MARRALNNNFNTRAVTNAFGVPLTMAQKNEMQSDAEAEALAREHAYPEVSHGKEEAAAMAQQHLNLAHTLSQYGTVENGLAAGFGADVLVRSHPSLEWAIVPVIVPRHERRVESILDEFPGATA